MKTIRDFLRKHALLLLAALVVLSIPAGAAFGKYAQRVTVTDKLNLSVEMKTYKLVTGGSFKSAIAINCWNVKKIKFCNASYVKKELGDNSESYKCKDKNGKYVTVNENGSGNIYLYYDSNTGTAYVAPETDGTIYANENCAQMFYAFDSLGNNIPYSELTEIDFGNFNTSKVTDMNNMFTYHTSNKTAPKLTQLNLSGFDTSNVTTMASIFSGQSELTSLDLSSFNTANVTDMSSMFGACYKLWRITLGDMFNTSNVTTMNGMFSSCINLNSFPLDMLDTSNVTDMSYMFHATGFTELDLTKFNTSKVTKMYGMFAGWWFDDRDAYQYSMSYSPKLKRVDLSSFNTSNVTNMGDMFYDAKNLKTIIVSDKFVTSSLTPSQIGNGMFCNCNSLVGEKETRYNWSNRGPTYARIDNPPDNPGYFTAAPGTSTTSTFSATGTDAAAKGFGLTLDLAS